jgi:prepilin-type N-terminal cleavage/methylation domain-containing protein
VSRQPTTDRPAQSGFTLLEVLIALAVVVTVIAGVGRLFSVAVTTTGTARALTSTTNLALQKLEQLEALSWGTQPGSAEPVSDVSTDLSQDVAAGGGGGLAVSPSDTLDHNTVGYNDFLDAAGMWVGSGVTPTAGAVFIRRWNVAALTSDPANTRILQVFVTTIARDRAEVAGGTSPGRDLPTVRLVSIRTRVVP